MDERTIEIAAAQMSMRHLRDFDDHADHVREMLDAAAGADLVVLPEWFTIELFTLLPEWRQRSLLDMRSLEGYSSSLRNLLRGEAEARGQVIAGGSMLVETDAGPANAAHVYMPDGRIVVNAKTHCVPVEKSWNTIEGDGLCVFEAGGVVFGLTVCYEVEFGELVATLADHGIDVLLVPSLSGNAPGYWRLRHCAAARAIEHQIYVVLDGLTGELGGPLPTGWSRSAILAPCDEPWPGDGVLAVAEDDTEQVIRERLDVDLLHRRRRECPSPTANDRRRKREWYEQIRAAAVPNPS
jgi:predicted amidohydrolase